MPRVQPKRPVMPRAHRTPVVDVTARHTAAGVGTVVVKDVRLPLVKEHGQPIAANLDVLGRAFGKLVERTEGRPHAAGYFALPSPSRSLSALAIWLIACALFRNA